MAYSFTHDTLAEKLNQYGITDVADKNFKVLFTSIVDDAHNAFTALSAGTLTAEEWDDAQQQLADNADRFAQLLAPAGNAPVPTQKRSASKEVAPIIPDAQSKSQAADYTAANFAKAMKDANATKITDICIAKPTPKKRFGSTTTFKVKGTQALLDKWEKYDTDKNVEILDKEAYDELVAILKDVVAGKEVTEAIYLNPNAIPAIAGYEYETAASGKKYVKGDRASLAILLSEHFAGQIPTNDANGLGAQLSLPNNTTKSTKNRGKVSARVLGKGAFFNVKEEPDKVDSKGIATYEVDTTDAKSVSVTVRSAKSFRIVTTSTSTDTADGTPKTVKKTTTVRLSGVIDVPALKRKAEFKDAFGEISNRSIMNQSVSPLEATDAGDFQKILSYLLEEATQNTELQAIKAMAAKAIGGGNDENDDLT